MQGIFITGTDTSIGKTFIACKIASELISRNINVIPRKPVESGCTQTNNKLIPEDAVKLKQAAQSTDTIETICRWRFKQAISPASAAQLNNQHISLDMLTQACTKNINKDHFLLIEGAGGFYSPICENALNADLAKQLNLPLILVAENRVGCINQVLLCLHAIEHYKLKVRAIVLNQLPHSGNISNHYNELSRHTSIPIFMFDKDQHPVSYLVNHLLNLN
ncbi:Dethiobiotin synthetase [hydrothermal vent metagenome]|uniref:Dethiobiotin synthetase n=1 Tax=hydrothermal vent metagenome TaxID=652676 RepID=A0A3B0XX30_9ZZZZ